MEELRCHITDSLIQYIQWHLLSTYYVWGMILGTGDRVMMRQSSFFHGDCIFAGETDNKQEIKQDNVH